MQTFAGNHFFGQETCKTVSMLWTSASSANSVSTHFRVISLCCAAEHHILMAEMNYIIESTSAIKIWCSAAQHNEITRTHVLTELAELTDVFRRGLAEATAS